MESPAAGLAPSSAPPRGAAAHRLCFLVVDKDPLHRMVIGKVGEKAGYAVTTAATADDAATKLAHSKFDCISLDATLAGQHDSQVLRGIARSNGDVMLIVVNSAAECVREETIDSARDLRLTVVELPRPVDLATLRTKLAGHAAIAQA
jgi:two-component system, chemotaxis family, chemotaxis protein CheY